MPVLSIDIAYTMYFIRKKRSNSHFGKSRHNNMDDGRRLPVLIVFPCHTPFAACHGIFIREQLAYQASCF